MRKPIFDSNDSVSRLRKIIVMVDDQLTLVSFSEFT